MVKMMSMQNLSTIFSSAATSLNEFLNHDPLMNDEDQEKCEQAAESLLLINEAFGTKLWAPGNKELAEKYLDRLLLGNRSDTCELRIWFDIKNHGLAQSLSTETLTNAADLLEQIVEADEVSRPQLRDDNVKKLRKLFGFLSKLEDYFEAPMNCSELRNYLQAICNPNE